MSTVTRLAIEDKDVPRYYDELEERQHQLDMLAAPMTDEELIGLMCDADKPQMVRVTCERELERRGFDMRSDAGEMAREVRRKAKIAALVVYLSLATAFAVVGLMVAVVYNAVTN